MCTSTLADTFNIEKSHKFLIDRWKLMKLSIEPKRSEETTPFFQLNLASSNFLAHIENITKAKNYYEASCVYSKKFKTPIANWCEVWVCSEKSTSGT